MKEKDIKVDLKELKNEKERNFKERLWFIHYWADYIRTHSDVEWSKQQNVVIDSQIKHARNLIKTDKTDKG